MAASPQAADVRGEEIVERAIAVWMRYVTSLGEVTSEYLRSLAALWGTVLPPLDLGWLRMTPSVPPRHGAAAPQPSLPTPAATASPALVLEAAAGEEARAVFAVSNRLARRVSAPVAASSFRDPGGREVRPPLRIEPDLVTLDPGQSALLQIVALIGDELDAGVSYRGAVTVPGLTEGQVEVLLRRRPGQPAATVSPRPAPVPAPRKSPRAKRGRRVAPAAPGAKPRRTRR